MQREAEEEGEEAKGGWVMREAEEEGVSRGLL